MFLNILSDGNYYFVVKAFNDEGLKSDYSNEVCGYIDPDKDYGIECGTEYPNEDGSSHGCFINVLNSPCSWMDQHVATTFNEGVKWN